MDYTFLKRQLRTTALHKRAALEPDFAARSAHTLVEFIDKLPLPENPVVSAYWPMKTELDLRPIMRAMHMQGITVCLPVVVAKKQPLLFRRWTPEAELVEGPYGTEQPSDKYEKVIPNILLLPLLAFDRQGGRLGYGGGFYDRTVTKLRQNNPSLVVIGAGFSAQEIDEVPLEDTDEKLNLILTEYEIIEVV